MSTLSSILRRLRTMPERTLGKKLINIPRQINMGAIHGPEWLSRQLASEIHNRKGVARARAETPLTNKKIPLPTLEEIDWDNHSSRTVLKILKKLKEKGVQGYPPRRKS